jgi:hypothetical protein
MLTATYALASMSVAQAGMRHSLLAYQQFVHRTLCQQQALSCEQLRHACDTLDLLYQGWHWQRIETCLIPAIRQATQRADQLCDELGLLNNEVLARKQALRQHAGSATGDGRGGAATDQVRASIDGFCDALLRRLAREEGELSPVARHVIDGDTWFAIAHQFLRDDARRDEQRRQAPAALLLAGGAVAPAPLMPTDQRRVVSSRDRRRLAATA